MEELLFFIFGMIAEALGLKKKTPAVPPAPLSPAPTRRPMPPPGNAPSPTVPTATSDGAAGMRPYALVRRPEAGGSAVPVEATTASFDARERDLQRETVPARDMLPVLNTPLPEPAPTLFAGPDDFVRAFILQEALGPPLCRRTSGP